MTTARTAVPAGPWTVDDELADGAYREVARGTGLTLERPFPVRVRLPR